MTKSINLYGNLSSPDTWARAIGCSARSIELWWQHHENADIPQEEMSLIHNFIFQILRGSESCCNLPFSADCPAPSPQEQRRQRLEMRAARANASAPKLLTYETDRRSDPLGADESSLTP